MVIVFVFLHLGQTMKYTLLVLLAALPACFGATDLGIFAAGAFSQAANGGIFQGDWWVISTMGLIVWVIITSAQKLDFGPDFGNDYLLSHAGGVLLGFITAAIGNYLFDFDQLLDINVRRSVDYDHTDKETKEKLEENYRAMHEGLPCPYPEAQRCIVKSTYTCFQGLFFTLGLVSLVFATYLFRGEYEAYTNDEKNALGGSFILVGILLTLAGSVSMYFRPTAWSHMNDNQHTIKYFLLLAPLIVVPVLYDEVVEGTALFRAGITILGYVAAWIIFFFGAVYVWEDVYLYQKPHHALWFAILGATPNILSYIGAGIANTQREDDAMYALLFTLISSIITVVIYFVVYMSGVYTGKPCSERCKID